MEITSWIRSVIVFGFARLVFGFEIPQVNMGRLLTIVAGKVDACNMPYENDFYPNFEFTCSEHSVRRKKHSTGNQSWRIRHLA